MTGRHNINVLAKVAIVVFLVFAILAIASMQMKLNEVKAEKLRLQNEINEYEESIENIENQLSLNFDDDYVEQIARDKLGLCYPDEILVENNLND
jgi:cell division protein FtsB